MATKKELDGAIAMYQKDLDYCKKHQKEFKKNNDFEQLMQVDYSIECLMKKISDLKKQGEK